MTYTREQILSMYGDELENAAAEVVCGWTIATDDIGVLWWKDGNGEKMSLEVLFQPSSDRNAAMELEARTMEKNSAKYIDELIELIYKPGIVQFDSYTGEETLTYEGVAYLMKATPEQRTKAAILAMIESGGTGE